MDQTQGIPHSQPISWPDGLDLPLETTGVVLPELGFDCGLLFLPNMSFIVVHAIKTATIIRSRSKNLERIVSAEVFEADAITP